MIISICSNPETLILFRLIKIFVLLIQIAVPIILIISVMLDFTKGIITSDSKTLVVNKVIAAVVVFLVPVFVNLLIQITSPNIFNNCIKNATSKGITAAYEEIMDNYIANAEKTSTWDDYSIAVQYLYNIKDNKKREKYEHKLLAVKTKIEKIDELFYKQYYEYINKNKSNTNNTIKPDTSITNTNNHNVENQTIAKYKKTYSDCRTYTTSYGKTFCLYDQCDSKWINLNSFCARGCATTSVLIAVTGYGFPATPFDNPGTNINPSSLTRGLTNNNVDAQGGSNNKDDIKRHIMSGHPVMVWNSNSNNTLSHYMLLIDYNANADMFYMANSFTGRNNQYGWYTWEDIFRIPGQGYNKRSYYFYGNMNPNNN